MDYQQSKLGAGFTAFLVVALIGFFEVFSHISGENSDSTGVEVTYEMPRPKDEIIGEFDLGARDIDRRFINPFAKKEASNPKAKAKTIDKKAEKAKSAQNRKPTTDKKKQDEAKKAEHEVRVVERAESETRVANNDSSTESQYENYLNANNDVSPEGESAEKRKDGRSPAQWRALLSADASSANMSLLVKALQSGDVDEGTFFSILEDLLKSQNQEKQKIGLQGLTSLSSLRAFAAAAHWASDYPALRPALLQYTNSYSTPSKHMILFQALQANDRDVAMLAAEVVLAGIRNSQSGAGGADPRQARGEIHAAGLDAWSRFVPIFQRWSQSSDSSLRSMASSILSLLPSSQA